MIEMTLHAVTVRCENLPEALALLDRWARMGEIKLPPAPRTSGDVAAAAKDVTAALDRIGKVTTTTTTFASVPPPSKPAPRRAPGTGTEMHPCGVCDVLFERPVGSRLVTCKDHRLKPGQSLPTERKRYQDAKAKAAPKPATKAPAKLPPDVAAAKGLLGRPPIKPTEPVKPCSACGDKAREADLDAKGRCPDCQPIGGKA